MYYILFFSGIFSIVMALAIDAGSNLASEMLFKILPLFFGLLQIFIAAKNLGWFS